MEALLQVFIVNGSPIMGRALQQLLDDAPRPCRGHVMMGAAPRSPSEPIECDVALLAPQNWMEFSRWLPFLRAGFSEQPWLLLAPPELAGLFLPQLDGHSCALVAPNASPEELWATLQALAYDHAASLRHELLTRFSRRGTRVSGLERSRVPTAAELQCGCGVSLGLANRQIAELLNLAEATVKTHVHHLLRKFELSTRTELGGYMQQALTRLPSRYD
jgi:DNA-binding NarL/FixJ family response regulator